MNEVKIRIAVAADAGSIVNISRETFYNAYAAFNTQANMENFIHNYFSVETIKEELNEEKTVYLIAENSNSIAGYAKLKDKSLPPVSLNNNNVIEVARIYASVNKINSGVGSMLMNECMAIAAKKKRHYIWLGVWEQNIKAVRFYERFGFKKFGTHIFMLGDDAQTDWLLAKEIISSN